MRQSHFHLEKKYFHISLAYLTNVNAQLKPLDWLFVQNIIEEQSKIYNHEIQCLVMMDTHVHFISCTKMNNENFFSAELQRAFGFVDVSNLSEPILNYSQYLNTYKYIYRNPVEAGLVARAEDYAYSSLYCLMGKAKLKTSIYDQMGLIQNPFQILNWINEVKNFKHSKLAWQNTLT